MRQAPATWIRDTLLRPRAGSISTGASAHLDMFRAAAAFLVLIAHWRTLLFIDGSQLRHLNPGFLFLYLVTKFGHQAVVVFFVLSGFLVGRTVLRPVWSKNWSTKKYLIHRFTRLEVVLIPALILCWFWDALGIHLFHRSAIYMGTAGFGVIPYNVAQALKLHVFFGNIAFLQTVFVPTFGSDDPLWSLTNEFWYYILFPCIVISVAAGFSAVKRVAAFAAWIFIAGFLWLYGPKGILSGFCIWLFGAVLSVLGPPSWLAPRLRSLAAGAAVLLVCLQLMITYAPFSFEPYVVTDYVLGILFAASMYFVLHDPRPVPESYRRSAKYTAGMSYTLYLTHMPALVFIAAWLGHRWVPGWRTFLIACALLLIPLGYAAVVAMAFERNTDRVRKRLEALVGL